MLITTLVLFLIILGVLVFVHEAGHFIVAKRAGAKVEEFGFGFPPRIFGVKRGETVYSINWIPLGGFVKILGEDGAEKDNPRSFSSKSIWQRFKILAAGVVANVILAVVLFSIVAAIGVPTFIPNSPARVKITEVQNNSPAKSAGIASGDTIISLGSGGQKIDVKKIEDAEKFINVNRGKEIIFTIKRGDKIFDTKTHARNEISLCEGATGVSLAEDGDIKFIAYPWYEAFWQGIMRTFEIVVLIVLTLFSLLKNIFVAGCVSGQLTGLIGIGAMVGYAAELGFVYVLQFTALLSVNLAIINALPFPALDGGRILFLVIEKIKGKPVSQETENLVHTIGFTLLILLMVLITFRDFGTYNVWGRIKNIL